ncbi:uncharacterized protein ASCRUDRAFT_28096, partial [Ascoidea rubescens DSM 1968]
LDDQNLIDWEILNDILSLDEDEPDFSKNLVLTNIIFKIELKHLNDFNKLLIKLSDLGHFIKGAAGSLGLITIQNNCERIQNYAKCINYNGFQID